MSTDFAVETSEHLTSVLTATGIVGKKVFEVYSQKDLESKVSKMKLPAIGVLYEGMRSIGQDQRGTSCEMVFSLLLLAEDSLITKASSTRDPSLVMLDYTRRLLQGTRSPTGHFWKFILEAPAAEVKGQILWLQRWTTGVQLSSKPAV